MANTYKIKDVEQISKRSLFIDANILIYLFFPTNNQKWENQYATIYKKLLLQGNDIYVDFITISEVINRTFRIEYKKQAIEDLNYKNFRNSDIGKEKLQEIFLIVKETILTNFKIINKSFNLTEIEKILIVDEMDMGDKSILLICEENNFVLLTNDSDFKNTNIDILTANNRLLN